MDKVYVIQRGNNQFLTGARGTPPRQAVWGDERPDAIEFPTWQGAQACLLRLRDVDAEGAEIAEEEKAA